MSLNKESTSVEMKEQTKAKKIHFHMTKKAWIVLGVVLTALFVVYIGMSLFFEKHFFFRSTVNGVNASGATAEKVMQEIEAQSKGYTLSIQEAKTKEKFSQKDLGISVKSKQEDFDQYLDQQNGFLWLGSLFSPKKYESKALVSYDEAKLTEKLKGLQDVVNTDITETQDAVAVYDNGKFKIQDEVYGNRVDMDALQKVCAKAIINLQDTVDLKADKCYVQPSVTKDSDTLKTAVDNLNKKVGISYTYTPEGGSESIPKDTLAGFLTTNAKGEITYNDDAIRAFVSTMGEKYNTVGKPFTINSSWGGQVTVPGGTYGNKIDADKEVSKIKSDLDAGKDVSRDFEYKVHAGSSTPSTYVEVNLTAQHMYVYKDGQQVISSDVVTGNTTKGTITHVGSYYIAYKEKDAVLRGDNYATPVAYWMPFHNGEGLHDATWQPSFGGTYYRVRGSHGCVNLPKSVAAQVFNTVSSGTPVFVYEMAGTENNAPNVTDANNFVNDVNTLVASPITLDSEASIAALEKRWKKLTPEAQAMVTNYASLTDARAQLDALKVAAGIPLTTEGQ